MKITLMDEESLRVEWTEGMLTVEADSPERSYSPYHMLGSSLAMCTWFLLESWAETAKLDAKDLVVETRWEFVEDPHRVGNIDLTFRWPSLPDNRRKAAERVAEQCPVHHTLIHPPQIKIEAVS